MRGKLMPNSTKQKFRAIEILRILQEESDYEHPITTQDFCAKLEQKGISCDRRTLSTDISDLVDLGFEIGSTEVGKQKGYFYEGFLFTVDDLKVLIDAVQASSFIPEKRTEQLMDKLSKLAGFHKEEVLKGNMISFNTRKHTDESIMYNVGLINDAIAQNKKISFRYYDLDENHKKKFRKSKKRYIESPIALVYNEDNYYLVCYSDKYETNVNYRVDRMNSITITEADIPYEAGGVKYMLPNYTRQSFKMFDGETETITIQFDDSLIGPVYDKFGEDIKITRDADNTCEATIKVQVSPTFWGWLMQFGNKLIIKSPKELQSELIRNLDELKEAYKKNELH